MYKFDEAVFRTAEMCINIFSPGQYSFHTFRRKYSGTERTKFMVNNNDSTMNVYGYTDSKNSFDIPICLFEIEMYLDYNNTFDNHLFDGISTDSTFKYKGVQVISSEDNIVLMNGSGHSTERIYSGTIEIQEEELFQLSTIYDMDFFNLFKRLHELLSRDSSKNLKFRMYVYPNPALTMQYCDDIMKFCKDVEEEYVTPQPTNRNDATDEVHY